MGKGIQAAMELKPTPDVVVVLTDGFTPWPDKPPKAKVIVGLLDPAFDPLYYEDVDWCIRIKQAGYRIFYVPQAKAMHRYHRESARGVFNRMTYHHLRNIFRFFIKHRHSPLLP